MLAIEKGDGPKIRAYIDAAMAEAPKLQTWKNNALSEAVTTFPVNEPVIRELLALGANPDATLELVGRILSRAVGHAHRIRALEIMLEAGADANAHGNREAAPVEEAARQGNIAGVKVLLPGADPNGVDGDEAHGAPRGREGEPHHTGGGRCDRPRAPRRGSETWTRGTRTGTRRSRLPVEWDRPGVARVLLASTVRITSTAPTKEAAALVVA